MQNYNLILIVDISKCFSSAMMFLILVFNKENVEFLIKYSASENISFEVEKHEGNFEHIEVL